MAQLRQRKSSALPPRPTGPIVAQFMIDDLPETYGLKLAGTCLEPAITDSSVVVVSKSAVPQTGDFVVLHFRPEARTVEQDQLSIKRLASAMPRKVKLPYREHPQSEIHHIIFVETLNPPARAWYELQDLLAVHKVIGVKPNATSRAKSRKAVRS